MSEQALTHANSNLAHFIELWRTSEVFRTVPTAYLFKEQRKHRVEGATIPVLALTKTVADGFKYRNKIGLDVAIEALKECWRSRRCTINDFSKYAKVFRVQNVTRRYLNSIAA